MDVALAMARQGLGATAPNPSVGAVVVDEDCGKILGRGVTQRGGRPHAEPEALRAAGSNARGKTLYVTLEPCSHHGKTPPCVSVILEAGIQRVVCGVTDPDPRVSGRGLKQLSEAGVSVDRGVRLEDARWVTRGHILRVSERRPFVQLKLAVGADGRIAEGQADRPVWVTSPQARAHGHLLRAQADAILIGAGTLRTDNPTLTCRLPGLDDRSPHRVVLLGSTNIADKRHIFGDEQRHRVTVFCGSNDVERVVRQKISPQVETKVAQTVGGSIWLPSVLERLAQEGVTRLLVEGGPAIWRAFSQAGLVDEVVLYHAKPSGERKDGSPDISRVVAQYLPGSNLSVRSLRQIGEDYVIGLRPA